MPADESALLAAVAADPAADLPRLVYADWLDDHGQPVRSEFIRLQCEIARLEVGPRAVVDANSRLWKRQQDLLDDHLPEVLGPAAFLEFREVTFTRGLPSGVSINLPDFWEIAEPLAALVTPLRVRVWHAFLDLERLLACPHLAVVTDLELSALGPPAPPPFDGLVPLAAEVLGRLPRLEALDLRWCELGNGDIARLLLVDTFSALRELNLAHNLVDDSELTDLLNTGLPRRLHQLVLDGNPLTDQAAFELADRLAPVATFRTLDIRGTQIGRDGQAALTAAFGSRCNLS